MVGRTDREGSGAVESRVPPLTPVDLSGGRAGGVAPLLIAASALELKRYVPVRTDGPPSY